MSHNDNRLTAQHLSKQFRGRQVLDDVSLHIRGGEIFGLFGPNGAGKTTCFYIIVGLLRPDNGLIYLNNDDISHHPIHKRAQCGIAYLPQERSIFTDLSALENVQAIVEINNRQSSAHNRQAALALLDEMGIGHLANALATTLSGGEQRRVEIARLLALKPAFVLMDEPFAALSPLAVRDLQTIIQSLAQRGIGVLITDHNLRETLEICHRGCVLHECRVLIDDTPDAIKKDKIVQKVYSGDLFTND